MNFLESTQKAHWLYTPDQLAEIRQQNRETSISTILRLKEEFGTTETSNGTPLGTAADGRVAEGSGAASAGKRAPKPISLDEELKLLKYYKSKIQAVCSGFRFPHKVQATALLFFARFYLSYSSLDHDPKNIMLTAIYLACKTEEAYISAEEFCRVVGQDAATVLRNEVALLQGLRFDLVVYHPYRPIQGFLTDMEQCGAAGEGLDEALQQLGPEAAARAAAGAQAAADALMLTDAPLLFAPGTLALAALRSAFRKLDVRLHGYLQRVVRRAAGLEGDGAVEGPTGLLLERLLADLARVDGYGAEGAKSVDAEEVKKIDRKLKRLHNPLLDPTTAAYKKAAAEKEEQEKSLREQKLQERRAARAASEADLLGTSGELEQPPAKRRRSELPA